MTEENPLFQTPNGKTIEIVPDMGSSLWVIHPHGTNLPNYLKGTKYTSSKEAAKQVLKWIETIKEKQK